GRQWRYKGRTRYMEVPVEIAKRHTDLRSPRTGQAWLDGREVERESIGVHGLGRSSRMEQPLLFHVRLDQLHLLLRAAGELEVSQGLLIHREDPHCGTVLGRHVADGGAVGEGQSGDPGTVELHELPDHALLAEHLR